MTSSFTVGSIVCKGVKLILILVILTIYARGYDGKFMGIGGQWNLNEVKNSDMEIVASGVIIGFLIYTIAILISYCFGTLEHKKTSVEAIMNGVGSFLFIVVGGIALHYWIGYLPEHKSMHTPTEKMYGVALGCLCILNGIIYVIDLLLSSKNFFFYDYVY